MSSVLKSKRRPSKFEVIQVAYDFRIKLDEYIDHDFYVEIINEKDRIVLNNIRYFLINETRALHNKLVLANSIYITNLLEYEQRRLYQDEALGHCTNIVVELQYLIRKFKGLVNVNKYSDLINILENEQSRIKGWRQSDIKLKPKQ